MQMIKNLSFWVLLLSLAVAGGIYFAQNALGAGSSSIIGQAEIMNTGESLYFDSDIYNSNVVIGDPDPNNNNLRTLSGYAWSADLGWVDFGNSENGGPVVVDYATGALSGRAYVLNTGGFIDFSGDDFNANVIIDPSTGVWSGYGWSNDAGWINFGETGVQVQETDPPTNPNSTSGYGSDSKVIGLSSAEGVDSELGTEDDVWYNYEQPYFEWSGASDEGSGYVSGLAGYYVYFGTDANAIPETHGSSQEEAYYTAGSLTSGETYYLRVQAYDTAGNVYTDPAEDYTLFTYKFDSTQPANPAGLSAPQTYRNSIDSFTIYWPDEGDNAAYDLPVGGSGIKGYQYKIGEAGTWYGSLHTGEEDCNDIITTTSYTLDPEFDNLQTGENNFYLRTIDNACNITSSAVSAILKYSGEAPSEPQNLSVDPATNEQNSFAFSWQAPSTFTGQESGLSYCYTVNTVPSALNCSWTSDLSLAAGAYATQPGTNTFYVVAKDEAGNVNYDAYSSINFTANTSAPGVPRSVDVADISIKATSNWKLAISWEEPSEVGAGVESYYVFRSTSGTDCSSNFSAFSRIGTTAGTSYTDVGLSQQNYYYCLKACDSANNCSAVSATATGYPTGKFTEPASLTAKPVVSGITTKQATITWSTDRNSDSKIQYGSESGEYYEEELSKSAQTTDHSITLSNLSAGTTYYFKAKWTDVDGNTGLSDEYSFATDPAPTVQEVSTSNINLDSAIVQFTSKDASKAQIYYGPTTTFGGVKEINVSALETTYSVDLTDLEDGTKYFYRVNLFDSEDEEYQGDIYSFTTLPRPRLSNVRIQQVRNSAQPTILVSWQSNTDVSSIVTYWPANEPAAVCDEVSVALKTGQHEMLVRGLYADTAYKLQVKGRDKIGNEAVSDILTFNTATDTRPPAISDVTIEGLTIPPNRTTGQDSTAQLVVAWNTDEPATSQVEFGEGTGSSYPQTTQLDTKLTYNHLVVISNLTPSKVYHLRAISKDKAGNEAKSVDQVVITPKATDNALDLVITNLSEAFSFFGGLKQQYE